MDYDTLINQSRQNAAIEAEEMNLVALLRPRVFIDGNKWCVLYGDDLMNGVAGFGDSPIRAVCDFNRAWRTPIAQQPAAVDDAMRKVAAIAHSGGLLNMSEADALTAIRRLSLPYWGKEEKPEQVRSTLAGQQEENGNG